MRTVLDQPDLPLVEPVEQFERAERAKDKAASAQLELNGIGRAVYTVAEACPMPRLTRLALRVLASACDDSGHVAMSVAELTRRSGVQRRWAQRVATAPGSRLAEVRDGRIWFTTQNLRARHPHPQRPHGTARVDDRGHVVAHPERRRRSPSRRPRPQRAHRLQRPPAPRPSRPPRRRPLSRPPCNPFTCPWPWASPRLPRSRSPPAWSRSVWAGAGAPRSSGERGEQEERKGKTALILPQD